jgi:dihydrofolate reductase
MTNSPKIKAIAVCEENFGIGYQNRLPWSIESEYRYFLRVIQTTQDKQKQNAVIMGRLTWQSNSVESQPFESCLNIIVSSTLTKNDLKTLNPNANLDQVFILKSLKEAVQFASEKSDIESIYVIGGSGMYAEAIGLENFNRFYLTRVKGQYECDVFLKPKEFFQEQRRLSNDKLQVESELFGVEYNKEIVDSPTGISYRLEAYEKKQN